MKSFIRYLYEYQNGKRTRNTGFVKVLEQTDTAEIQIYGRGFPVAGGRTLEIYLFYEEDGKCIGIRMGEIRGAQAAFGYKLSYTTDDVGGDGQFGRIGGMILRAGNGADAGYYGAVWDETRPVDVSRMITEEEWKLNKSGKNKKIANGGDVLSNEKYEKPGNEKILEEKTSQRKYENIEEQETSEQSKNTDAVRKSKSNPNVPEERNSQNANSDLPPKTTKDIIYKITRQELAGLPRKEWKLANNHFLLHGYYNYHHLVSFEKEGKCWIGVPGLYFSGEQRAAGAFGFSQFMKPSDGELDLEEYEIEDEEHFGYWCRPVGAVIRKEVKEKEDAEDILQDVFYQLVKAVSNTLNPIEQVTSWLYRVTRNTIINKGKKKSEEEWPVSAYAEEESVLSEFSEVLFANDDLAPSPETEYMRSLVWQELEAALGELPAEQRTVFELMELEGLSVKEVAEATGASANTVLSRKHYAVKHLRKRLEGLYNDILTY